MAPVLGVPQRRCMQSRATLRLSGLCPLSGGLLRDDDVDVATETHAKRLVFGAVPEG